jgi:hypothetical protein
MEIAVLPTTNPIVAEFAEAAIKKDMMAIENLLSDEGKYEMQTKNLIMRKANKKSFLKWFKMKLSETPISEVDHDKCIQCFIGNPVLLFNKGTFPVIAKNKGYRSKMGLMLDIQDSKIEQIKFCALFLETENPFVYELRMRGMKDFNKDL